MIAVAHASPTDAKALAELMQEVDEFYGEANREAIDAKVASINSALFADAPHAFALLARAESHLVGFATYSILWPAVMSTKSLYLKELYVSLSHRRSGIGRILMAHICNVALESECSRVEWTTDQDNRDAQKFYEGLGIHALPSKMFYRAEGDALRTVALSLRP